MHGLRRGEVLGLRWTDLTLEGPEPGLAVRQTRVLVHASVVTIGEPKTARGRRVLPLPAALVAALRDLSDRQATQRQLAGRAYEDTGPSLSTSSAARYGWSATATPFAATLATPACPTSGCTTQGTPPPR